MRQLFVLVVFGCVVGLSSVSWSVDVAVSDVPEAVSSGPSDAYAELGYLNVFTDLDQALIFVDGESVSRESLVKYPLLLGEHLVQVRLDDKLVYQQTVIIQQNRTSTVVSDHFVDIITKTPSRGAIDREARRLRESRGNFAMGLFGATIPQPAASVKVWMTPNVGVQGYALGSIPDTVYGGVMGARLLVSPGDKVFGGDVTHAYVYAGGGRYADDVFPNGKNYGELGMGVEAKLGEIARTVFFFKYLSDSIFSPKKKESSDTESITGNLGDMLVLAVLNLFYTSAEITIVSRGASFETGASLGFHVYF
jgi:hypothetical protein